MSSKKAIKSFIRERKENPNKRVKHKVKTQEAKEHKGERSFINTFPKKSKFSKADKVKMDKKEFIKEHKRLVNVLESESHKDDKKEAKKQKKEIKEHTKKSEYPKSGRKLGCKGPDKLTSKICRRNVFHTNVSNPVKKSKLEFIQDFKKAYDWRDVKVKITSEDQYSAERTASSKLIKYLSNSIDRDLEKIPFPNGTLTVFKKGEGLYSGFFSDEDGQVVEKFDDMTVALLAKNMEMKNLYSVEYMGEDHEDKEEDVELIQDMVQDALSYHNEVYHKGQVPGEPISGGKGHIKIKCGDFELDIKKSINSFLKSYRYGKDLKKSSVRKAISSWRRNVKFSKSFYNDYEAAKELVQNWDVHKESFNQILFAIDQMGKNE